MIIVNARDEFWASETNVTTVTSQCNENVTFSEIEQKRPKMPTIYSLCSS